ncbi:hypothetical protein LCM02_01380 [Lutimonas saemankumensis]|uniref:hypothetical protein n=1 Tax=Lutimonas saemankumensis TaxID=483016 RepID=UPI001CD1E5C0|nr:hypothetical protein [Lutimonas saemankumensis]MCA0931081.1 hypothetical protein [Lutimonas saemankumensis]
MKRKLLVTYILSAFTFFAFGQMDYSNVEFRSYIYKYKEVDPRTSELGIEKELLEEIVALLGKNIYSKEEQEEIVYKTWLAMAKPRVFDYVYKDFSVSSNKNWGSENANGEIVLEPNPYLTDWTVSDDEYPYFQLALNKILEYFQLMTYGDDAESVASSFNDLLITKDFDFKAPKDDDWAYSYIETVNSELEEKGLVALVTKGYYNIVVCDIDNKEQITELFEKFRWELVQP